MKLFGTRNSSRSVSAVPAGSGNAAPPVRLYDPIAQAMRAGNPRSADVIRFGGISFRVDGDAR